MGRCQTLKKYSNFKVLKAVKPHLASDGLRFFWRSICRQKLQHSICNVFYDILMHFLIVNLNNIFRKYPRFSGSPKMTHFQIRKTSFGSFSAVPTNFKILQILRNAGPPPASNSIESRSVWPRKRRKPQLSKISKSPAAIPSPYPLPLTLTP